MLFPVVSRKEWGAAYAVGREDPGPEGRVVMHHSYRPALTRVATVEQEIAAWRGIEHFHVNSKKWDGIGYNFGVAPSGRALEGRGWKYRGAHAGPVNGDSIGICLLIDGSTMEPTEEMMQTVRDLLQIGVDLGELKPDYKISGHRDHMPRTCPGDKVQNRLVEFYHNYKTPVLELAAGVKKGPLPNLEVMQRATARYMVTRYANEDEGILNFSRRVLEEACKTPFVQKKLGVYHGFACWGMKKLFDSFNN